jgi:hypothetical protein
LVAISSTIKTPLPRTTGLFMNSNLTALFEIYVRTNSKLTELDSFFNF